MSDEELQALVGLTVDEAQERVKTSGWLLRVAGEDGQSFPCTADLREDRVNVWVEKGRIASIDVG